MACLQRMVKSGARLHNYRAHSVNFAISPINRLRVGAPVNPYCSLCSKLCADGRSILPDSSRFDNQATFARAVALRAEGISVTESQVLAEFVKDLPKSEFDSLLNDISRVKSLEKDKQLLWLAGGCAGLLIFGMMASCSYEAHEVRLMNSKPTV